jgi:Zn-dependent metalloprotease
VHNYGTTRQKTSSGLLTTTGDWGRVHYSSGIPKTAFYLVAVEIGGHAWDAAGHILYESLKASTVNTDFQSFAETTSAKAAQL